jgi:hypothetical protein
VTRHGALVGRSSGFRSRERRLLSEGLPEIHTLIADAWTPRGRWFNLVQPRRAHDMARALSSAAPGDAVEHYPAALADLYRLREGGLVRRGATDAGPLYQITRRGCVELRLQRML